MDEHAQKLFDAKGAECERLRRLVRRQRKRLSTSARKIVNRQAEQIRALETALLLARREDE